MQLALALMSLLGNWFGKVSAKESLKMGEVSFVGFLCGCGHSVGGPKVGPFLIS